MNHGIPTKLTAAHKAEMVALRNSGMTHKEIAKHFSVSESRVQQILSRMPTSDEQKRIEYYVFPKIAEWMNDTGTSLARVAEDTGYNYVTISRYFRGINEPTISFIRAFLKLSGMTFEEAFAESEEIKNAAASGSTKGYQL